MLDYDKNYVIKGIRDIRNTYDNDYCNLTIIIYDDNIGSDCRYDCAFRKWCDSCARLMK